MSLTTGRKADIAYKYIKGIAQTGESRASYEEVHPYSLRVLPSQIWAEAELIPSTAPVLAPDAELGVVQYKEELVLTPEPSGAAIVSFFHEDLKDAIDPERFGDSYAISLKENDDTVIPPGFGNYEINPDAGVITFDENTVIASTPIKVTFYKYIGVKGAGSSGGSSILFVDDNTGLRAITAHSELYDKGVYSDGNAQVAMFKFDSLSTDSDNNQSIIKPDDIDIADPGRWIRKFIIPQVSADVVLGDAPAGGDWVDGISQYAGTEKLNAVMYDHEQYFLRLAPSKPQSIVAASMVMSRYEAFEAVTGDLKSNLTDETQPIGLLEEFYDPEAGNLTAEVDAAITGTILLTGGDDTGTDDALAVLENTDPHEGEGKPDEGWWMFITAQVQAQTALTLGEHTYQMKHATAGDNAILSFIVDDPADVTISSIVLSLPATSTRYVSGVPSLSAGQAISCAFDIVNAVKTHYNNTRLAVISGSAMSNLDIAPPVTPPIAEALVSYTAEQILIEEGHYIEDALINIVGYNSKDEAGVSVQTATSTRVDTLSDESSRLVAGATEYPATGYGTAFDPSISLINSGAYEEELQMLNGEYRRPAGLYTSNLPVAGPDYSGADNAYDYCIPIDVIALVSASSFELNILGAVGFTDVETPDVRIQIKVEGSTGWLDANSAFGLVGSPSNDGDAAMVFADSTATKKKVTFGQTPRTGQLYVRIGLPEGDSKRFAGVSITNIV